MHAIAAGLQAAGFTTRVRETRGVMDLTGCLHRPGGRQIEVIVDQNGYAELRYWNLPAATPAQIAATIVGALSAIAPLAQ
jgi:hypothetical protein